MNDRRRWDERWRERGGPGEPSPWVRSLCERLPTRGRALDVAGGAGRHALVLARHGLDVTIADVSPVALGLADAAARAEGLTLRTVAGDLEDGPLPPGPFDVLLCYHFLYRPAYRSFASVVVPGGTVAIVHMTRINLERNPHPTAQFLLEPGELPSLLPGVSVVSYEESWGAEGRHEARVIGVVLDARRD